MKDYNAEACRHLAAVLLLEAVWAARSDLAERAWLAGPEARCWAGLLGLTHWPPTPDALAQAAELARGGPRRRRVQEFKDEW